MKRTLQARRNNATKELIPTSEFPRLWAALLAEYGCSIGPGPADGPMATCAKPVPGSGGGGPFSQASIYGIGKGSLGLLNGEFDRRYPGLRDRVMSEELAQKKAEIENRRLTTGLAPVSPRLSVSASGRMTTLEKVQQLVFSPVGALFAVGFVIGWVKS